MDESKTLKDILDTVVFLRDHAASREDVHEIVGQAKSEIMTRVDSFIGLHQKLDTELVALRGKYDRLEAELSRVLRHLHLTPQA